MKPEDKSMHFAPHVWATRHIRRYCQHLGRPVVPFCLFGVLGSFIEIINPTPWIMEKKMETTGIIGDI